MKKTKILLHLLGIGVFITLYSFTIITQDEWVVPEEYITMVNPTDADDGENKAIGKSLYSKHCKSCHGKEGYGDGPKADEQEGDLGDFSTAEFHEQTDGELFYKVEKGRDDMPKFEKKIPDEEDVWLIVNYVRTLLEE
jgi:mono/diheme cytochrome c family protein